VNRLHRTALFPLIVIVLLVYLASQTLRGDSQETTKVTYSELVGQVRTNPAAVRKVVFKPNRHRIRAELANGHLEASYPTPQSQVDFERFLSRNGATYDFDWSDTSESPWWSLLTALLPFVLLFGFWSLLTKEMRDRKT